MKKAKFALTVIIVVAVVGGALAFKASRGATATVFVNTLVGGQLLCSAPVFYTNYTTQINFEGITKVVNNASVFSMSTKSCNQQVIIWLED